MSRERGREKEPERGLMLASQGMRIESREKGRTVLPKKKRPDISEIWSRGRARESRGRDKICEEKGKDDNSRQKNPLRIFSRCGKGIWGGKDRAKNRKGERL